MAATASTLVQRFRLTLVGGPVQASPWTSTGDRCAIGSHPSNDLVIDDPTVSRFHCELAIGAAGAEVRDKGSLNGTLIDGVRVRDAFLRAGHVLRLGRVSVRFDVDEAQNPRPVSARTELHAMVGVSVAMRGVFAVIERAARSDATVIIEGETGTGKGRAAEAIHAESTRRDAPFIVVDCGAIPSTLLESELFGHERGAFTGAEARRVGAFEEASGGTIFLDEIGELPLDLQPKLLRALETKEVRRVGQNEHHTVDVRVIAATNRDLREQVNAGRFRSDLYFRLAVVRVEMPPLRRRPEDIPLLVERMAPQLAADPEAARRLLSPDLLSALQHHAWPGNVRELRNYLQRCLVFEEQLPIAGGPDPGELRPDVSLDYVRARRKILGQFERGYLETLLAAHRGKVAAAAEQAGIDRVYFYRLLKRNGIKLP
jgi:DNA-binding NtrC family response regulator